MIMSRLLISVNEKEFNSEAAGEARNFIVVMTLL